MSAKHLLAVGTAALLAACESGDLNIEPSTNVTDSNNTINEGGAGGSGNPCASYVNTGGQTIQGSYDGTDCTYSPSFVDAGNNLRTDLTIPDLPDDGAHIFEGSLFVGETYNSDAEMMSAGVAEGGDGVTLTIETGATLAWESSEKFMIVNRGSQLFAVGTADEPITFTSVSDIDGEVGPEDVQQWGGIVINGFGVTNACEYTGSVGGDDLALDGECHVEAEGAAGLDQSHYGGDDNDDSSGRLEYVVVKHTGATVGSGDELNGITFGGVGRNTVVHNLQTYSTYDDGIEMFGGAVNFENFVGMYVRDDSIDIDEGWSGTITNALVIQSAADGNHCIEADGIGSYDTIAGGTEGPAEIQAIIDQGINSRPTIDKLTCIISPQQAGTHDPGAGWRFREGIFPTVNDSMVIGSFMADETPGDNDNYCLRLDNRTEQAAIDGDVTINSSIIACAEPIEDSAGMAGTETSEGDFFTESGNVFASVPAGGLDPTANADTDLQLLEGDLPVYSIGYAAMQVDGGAPAGAPQEGDFIGALSTGIPDWTFPWAYGLHPDSRGQPLWFE